MKYVEGYMPGTRELSEINTKLDNLVHRIKVNELLQDKIIDALDNIRSDIQNNTCNCK